ncbi:MAG TPA: hypothetical protein GXZ67_05735 [Clostridiaceae bacterium]|nr:hypothetical protein [Clostridiaceae bacterium]
MKKIIKTDDSSYFEADPRLHIFVGAYGSGKSEVSVHFARMLAEKHKDRQIILADLDIVNPFYRSADAISSLTEDNIRVIAPVYANTNVDVPALPPEINAIFDDGSVIGVLDLGGEDLGAKVLAGMRGKIEKTDFRVYMVINTFRPFTVDVDGIANTAGMLSEASRLPISGFIDNSNLLSETTGEELRLSYPVLRKASEQTGIPILFAAGFDKYLPADWLELTPDAVPLLRMKQSIFYNY